MVTKHNNCSGMEDSFNYNPLPSGFSNALHNISFKFGFQLMRSLFKFNSLKLSNMLILLQIGNYPSPI